MKDCFVHFAQTEDTTIYLWHNLYWKASGAVEVEPQHPLTYWFPFKPGPQIHPRRLTLPFILTSSLETLSDCPRHRRIDPDK